MKGVRVGQIWASTHRDDVEAGVRQRRRVVAVDPEYLHPRRATLVSEETGRMSQVLVDHQGGIRGHRLVEDALDREARDEQRAKDEA